MRTELCDRLGIEFPIFAFTHCRDVVAAVSQAGGRASITRLVNFEKTAPDAAKLEAFKKQLAIRAVETELYEKARAKREEHLKKQLEIKPDR